MNRFIGFILLLVALPTYGARDADIQISVAEIIGYGVFEASSTVRHSGFSKNKFSADSVSGIKFKEFTNTIPGKLGTNFGFQYNINTTPRGQKLKVRSVIRFPEPGLQRPGGRLYKESVEKTEITIGQHSLHGFGFDDSWEIVPGEWVFEIWYKKARLIRKTFTVVAEEES